MPKVLIYTLQGGVEGGIETEKWSHGLEKLLELSVEQFKELQKLFQDCNDVSELKKLLGQFKKFKKLQKLFDKLSAKEFFKLKNAVLTFKA
jgi:hypothetical protein